MPGKMMQILVCALGLLGMICFCIPVFTGKILNIGNGTGIAVSLIVFLCGARMHRLGAIIEHARESRGGRLMLTLAGVVLALVIGLVVTFTALIIRALGRQPSGTETVIVLGCRVYGERPSLMLRERIDAAYEYLREHPDAVCVLSGGKGSGETISEAECMYRCLTQKGIAPERLYREDRSASTRENLKFSLEIMKENALAEDIAIVTNEFHEYRAGKVAQELMSGEISAVPSRTAWWLLPTYYVRELYGILYQALL